MMDKKHNEPQDDSYYDALIKQRIGEALRNQSRKERLDLAQLEEWVEADRQRRRAKVKRILAVASCFIILCIGTFSLKFVFDPDDSIATAGKNDNKVTEEGNNAVVKPNEDGVDENTGVSTITCETWEAVEEAKKSYPELMVPEYIPEGYELNELNIELESSDLGTKFIFSFQDNKDEIGITQIMDGDTSVFNNYDRKIIVDKQPLLIKEQDGICAFYQKGEYSLYILTRCTDDELIKIVKGIT